MTDLDHTTKGLNHQGSQQLITKLQIAVAIMVPVFGAISTWQASQAAATLQSLQAELQQVRQETERKQKFAERIQSQLDNLTGGNAAKAKIALASLYTLAREEDDKSILFTIAIVSDNAAMKNTIADLVLEDTMASSDLKKKIKAKLGNILTAASEADRPSKVEEGKAKDVAVEKRLLESLTKQQETFSGWIYLGKVKKGSILLEDKSILTNTIPVGKSRQLIKTTTSLNLRSTPPTTRGLGAINGVIARGLVVRVDEVQKSDIDGSYAAIWARVTAPKVSK
ncbi:MAG: hypothetical protein ACKO58_02090 [Cyanobium sp.]